MMDVAERPGRVFWITGLSGAGKSTLGRELCARLRQQGQRPVLLDGDAVRSMLLESNGHDRESRLEIARFNGRLCKFISLQGIDVVCPTISLFHACQEWNRANIPNYLEILLDVPIEALILRDRSGLYARARRGEEKNVVGVDIAPEIPRTPDIVFTHAEALTPHEMSRRVLERAAAEERT